MPPVKTDPETSAEFPEAKQYLSYVFLKSIPFMLPGIPAPEKDLNKAYFSPGFECQKAIITAMRNAQKSIKICVFTISDNYITKAILQAHRRNIPIQLITDNEKLLDLGSDIRQLAQKGIEIRTDNRPYHMHHKFAIIDDQLLITGSYNWTRSAALYNHENIILSGNKELVKEFVQQFELLWVSMNSLVVS